MHKSYAFVFRTLFPLTFLPFFLATPTIFGVADYIKHYKPEDYNHKILLKTHHKTHHKTHLAPCVGREQKWWVFGGCCGGCLATPTTPKPPVFKGVPGDFALKMVGVAEKFCSWVGSGNPLLQWQNYEYFVKKITNQRKSLYLCTTKQWIEQRLKARRHLRVRRKSR